MKIKTSYLIYPILILVVIIIGCVFALNALDVKQTTLGYDYKAKLFQSDKLNTIELTVSEKNWNEILDNPTAEQYVEADIKVNGESYDSVGLRAKGNSSLTMVASSDSDRYSLKIDFAEYNKEQNYYGLQKINLNNGISDSSQIKEYLSYTLMQQFGIPTPAFSYSKVYLNGEYYGLMLTVEDLGDAFVRTNFNTSEGFLFKPEDTGSDLKYTSDNIEDYSGILNGIKSSSTKEIVKEKSNIVSMMKEISNNDYSSLNVDEVVKYFALNTAIVSMDSYQGTFTHNFYLYEDKNGKFSIIPWDYNMSFGGFSMGGFGGGGNRNNTKDADTDMTKDTLADNNKVDVSNTDNNARQQNQEGRQNRNGFGFGGGNNFMDSGVIASDSAINLSIYSPVQGTTLSARPLLNVILQNEETLTLYEQYLEEISTQLLTEENIKSIVAPLEALLYEAVDADTTKFTTTEKFVEGIRGEDSLVNFAIKRSEAILNQLNDETLTVETANASTNSSNGMPNFEGGEIPNFGDGQTPPNFEGGEMPNFEGGGMPNFEGGQTPPNGGGEMPNFGNGQGRPNFEGGEMPNFEGGGMPNFGDGQGRPNFEGGIPNFGFGGRSAAENSSVQYSGKQVLMTLGISLALLIVAMLIISWFSNLKYQRRR